MSAPVRLLSCCIGFVLFSLLPLVTLGFAQTSINDLHIAPRSITSDLHSAHPTIPKGLGVIRSTTDLVMVPVTITDNFNRPVTGLDLDNFQLYEDKKPQQIKNFSNEDTPVSIGLIVDLSGSMANKIDRTEEAVAAFCREANPQDEFFMITFADEPQLAVDFTNNTDELQNALLTIPSKGRTSLLDAIYMGLRKMKDARYPRKALLILSDGGDNHSRYSERDVKNAARESDVLMYAVGTYDRYVSTQEELLGPELLQSISDVTGGKAYTLSNVQELPAVVRLIGIQLRHQYVLAYSPETKPRNGKWYKISVKLRLPSRFHTFLRVNARPGYYASLE